MTNWKELLEEAMQERNETLADLEACTMSDSQLTAQFDGKYDGPESVPFWAWTATTVYFPTGYDGSEWVGGVCSVSRHPDGKATEHQGG